MYISEHKLEMYKQKLTIACSTVWRRHVEATVAVEGCTGRRWERLVESSVVLQACSEKNRGRLLMSVQHCNIYQMSEKFKQLYIPTI